MSLFTQLMHLQLILFNSLTHLFLSPLSVTFEEVSTQERCMHVFFPVLAIHTACHNHITSLTILPNLHVCTIKISWCQKDGGVIVQ